MKTTLTVLWACTALAVTAGSAAGQGSVTVVPGTTTHRLKPAGMAGGPTSMMIRDEEVEFQLGGGETRYGRLLVLFNAPAGRFWWEVYPNGTRRSELPVEDGLGDSSFAFVAADRLVVFIASYKELRLNESAGVAGDAATAEAKALDAIRSRPSDWAYGKGAHWKTIALALPPEFYYDSPRASTFRQTKLLNVVHDAGKWVITIQCEWKEEITLDSDYRVLETRKVN